MRPRLATRPARLALAVVAAAALTASAAATASASTGHSGAAQQKAAGQQACGTDDLKFTVSSQTQAGGYLLVTAKAKPGITCYLEGTFPSAAFGSAADTHVSNAEQGVTDTVKVSGSSAAYAGINPKSTNSDGGKEFGQLIIAVAGDETNPVTVKLPETVSVDAPVATNWHADPADAVPFTG